ncbi:MAG: glycosyltransferase family 2 protein, partial [Solirubrobacterales bacterium]
MLDSLDEQTAKHEVIVVDNGSTDRTSHVLAAHADVEVIRLERNVGFGPAVNLAARRASGDALVLVNDDSVLDPGFVEAISSGLAGDVVMTAGVMRDAADETLIDTAGMELDRTLNVFDYLNGSPLASVESAADPIGPSGAAAAFDREAFVGSGGFDEALFAYWEDVDLVLRLRLEGGVCRLMRDAVGTHDHSATLGFGSPEKNALMGFGRGYLLRKWSVISGPRALSVIGADGAICMGQALIDRNLAGVSSRIQGARAARPSFSYPAEFLNGDRTPGMLEDLRRRLRRRRRLKRRREETPRMGLDRELAHGERWLESADGAFSADLTDRPRDPIRIGGGNVVFLGGRLSPSGGGAGKVELLADGVPAGGPVTVVNPGGGGPAYWWTTLEIPRTETRDRLRIALRARAGDQGEVEEVAELATLELDPAPKLEIQIDGDVMPRALEVAEAEGAPMVAICMATYDPPSDLFAHQIESIRAQTHRGWICLISDDGSTPERLAMMREKIGDDPRYILIENEDRLGFYGNYERALGTVRPETQLVALADQDDRWYPEKLEALIAGLGDRDLVYGDMRIVADDGSRISDTYWSERRNNYTDFASMLVGNTVTGSASLFRADLLDRALPFPAPRTEGYHDHWIALVAMTRGGLAYVGRPLQDYVQHEAATQGHAEANRGARYLQPRLIAVLSWQWIRGLLGRGASGWASRCFGMYARTVI